MARTTLAPPVGAISPATALLPIGNAEEQGAARTTLDMGANTEGGGPNLSLPPTFADALKHHMGQNDESRAADNKDQASTDLAAAANQPDAQNIPFVPVELSAALARLQTPLTNDPVVSSGNDTNAAPVASAAMTARPENIAATGKAGLAHLPDLGAGTSLSATRLSQDPAASSRFVQSQARLTTTPNAIPDNAISTEGQQATLRSGSPATRADALRPPSNEKAAVLVGNRPEEAAVRPGGTAGVIAGPANALAQETTPLSAADEALRKAAEFSNAGQGRPGPETASPALTASTPNNPPETTRSPVTERAIPLNGFAPQGDQALASLETPSRPSRTGEQDRIPLSQMAPQAGLNTMPPSTEAAQSRPTTQTVGSRPSGLPSATVSAGAPTATLLTEGRMPTPAPSPVQQPAASATAQAAAQPMPQLAQMPFQPLARAGITSRTPNLSNEVEPALPRFPGVANSESISTTPPSGGPALTTLAMPITERPATSGILADTATPAASLPDATSQGLAAPQAAFAQALAHATTQAQPQGDQPPVQMHTPFGAPGWQDEVGQNMVWAAGHDQHQADLVLNPANLGRIEISISVTNDQATASFVSANAAVRDALEQALPRLREMFANAGITLGDTSVGAESSAGGDREASRNSGRRTSRIGGTSSLTQTPASARNALGLVDTFA